MIMSYQSKPCGLAINQTPDKCYQETPSQPCYRDLPQHQTNELLSSRHTDIARFHGGEAFVFPRSTVNVCLERRGKLDWEEASETVKKATEPSHRPIASQCNQLPHRTLRHLTKHSKKNYQTQRPSHSNVALVHQMKHRGQTASLWNHPTRLYVEDPTKCRVSKTSNS